MDDGGTERSANVPATAGTRRRYSELQAELLKPGEDGSIFQTSVYQLYKPTSETDPTLIPDDRRFVVILGPEKDDPDPISSSTTQVCEVSADGKTITTTSYLSLIKDSKIPVEIRDEALEKIADVNHADVAAFKELLPEVPDEKLLDIPEDELVETPFEGHPDDIKDAPIKKYPDVSEARLSGLNKLLVGIDPNTQLRSGEPELSATAPHLIWPDSPSPVTPPTAPPPMP